MYMDCPPSFTEFTSLGLPTGSVFFYLPNATDNSNNSVTVECFAPMDTQPFNNMGGLLEIGVHLIMCNATDLSMQVNVSCSFNVTIEGNITPCFQVLHWLPIRSGIDCLLTYKCLHAASKLWNSLPRYIRSPQTIEQFKTQLKSHLFYIAYCSV